MLFLIINSCSKLNSSDIEKANIIITYSVVVIYLGNYGNSRYLKVVVKIEVHKSAWTLSRQRTNR